VLGVFGGGGFIPRFLRVKVRARSKFAPTGWYIFVGEVINLAQALDP